MTAGICGCCGLWGARDGGGRCRTCAANMKKLGRCRHKSTSAGAVFAGAERAKFYIVGGKSEPDPRHEWHGIEDYISEAIRRRSSDELLAFLHTGIAVEICAALELHHQQHGAILWSECPDRECNRSGLAWTEIAIAHMAREFAG